MYRTPLLHASLLACLALGACSEPPTEPLTGAPLELPTALAVTSNGWTPFPLVVQKCGGEVVHVSGDKHETFRLVRDGNDGVHAGYHLNFLLKGESATGVRYHYSGNQSSQVYLRYPSLADKTELRVRMRAQGSRDDLIVRFSYHITVTPDGDVATFFSDAFEECGTGASGGTPSA